MMSMRLESEDNNIIRQFYWKKEWVRPYESAFSIIRIFCKVNGFTGRQAFKILGINPGNKKEYQISFAAGCINLYEESFENTLKKLVPRWYLEQIHNIQMPDFPSDSIITNHLMYCPECEKESYHSLFHNIAGIQVCPLHHTVLKKCPDSPNALKIIFNVKDNTENVYNAHTCILPCNRKVSQSYYLNVKYRRLNYILPISPLLSDSSKSIINYPEMLLNTTPPDSIITIPKTNLSNLEIFISLLDEIRKLDTPVGIPYVSSDVHLSTDYREYSFSKVGAISLYRNIWIMYKKYIKMFDSVTYENMLRIRDGYMISANDLKSLALCFIWIMADCENPIDAFSVRYIFYSASEDFNYHYELNPLYESIFLKDNNSRNSTHEYDKKADLLIAQLAIQNDCFNYLWNQFQMLSQDLCCIYSKTAWELIKYPMYYLTVVDKKVEILRYNKGCVQPK